MLRHYITVAFRNLWKYRLQNITGITGLSLGFICFSVVVFEIEWRTGYNAWYPGAERIYTLRPKHNSDYIGNIYNLNQAFPEIEKITFKIEDWQNSYFTFDSVKAQYYNFKLFECDTAFMDFFSIKLLVGNKYAVNKTTNSIVLFDTKAKQIDKNMKSLIGRTIYLGDETFQVTGIAKAPVNSFIISDDGLVINREGSVFRDEIYSKWNPEKTLSYIMVKNKASVKKFEEALSNRRFNFELYKDRLGYTINDDGTLSRTIANEEDERFTIEPLREALPREMIVRYFEKFLVGLLILLVTLFNYTAFQTAQFYSRLKECALRRTAGAGKKDLFFLFFSEIIIAFTFVYIVSILLLNTLGKYIHEQDWFYLPDISILQISMLKYILFVLAIASVLYIIPINIIHRMSIRTVFLGISRKGRKGIARFIMLFFQLGVLLMFLSAFAIVGLQTNKSMSLTFNHLSKEEKMNIVYTYITVADALKNNIDVITNKISSSSFVDGLLVTDDMATNKPGLLVAAKDEELGLPNFYEKWIGQQNVSPDFFNFFQCQLLKGEFLTKDSSPYDVVVDEIFASYYKDKNPVGESFSGYKIVGVIKNLNTFVTKDNRFCSDKYPVFYGRTGRINPTFLYVKSHRGRKKEVEELIKTTLKEVVPPHLHSTIYLQDLDKSINDAFYTEIELFRSMLILSVISLVICLLGIYSAIVMETEKRRKEIAIRKINGATVKDIIILFGKRYIGLWTIACVLFSPFVYYFGNKWLEKYIERISLNAGLFVAIYLAIMILVVLTVIFRILKVARCNPAEVIKKE